MQDTRLTVLSVGCPHLHTWANLGAVTVVQFMDDLGWSHERVWSWPVVNRSGEICGFAMYTPGGDEYVEALTDYSFFNWSSHSDSRDLVADCDRNEGSPRSFGPRTTQSVLSASWLARGVSVSRVSARRTLLHLRTATTSHVGGTFALVYLLVVFLQEFGSNHAWSICVVFVLTPSRRLSQQF